MSYGRVKNKSVEAVDRAGVAGGRRFVGARVHKGVYHLVTYLSIAIPGFEGSFAAVQPGKAESDEGADGDGAEYEDDSTGDGDPSDDDQAGGDDGAGFRAGDGEVAEGEFLRFGGAAAVCVIEHVGLQCRAKD